MSVCEALPAVLRHYPVGEILDFQRIERGYVNQTWLVKTSTGRYVLKRRQANPINIERVEAQQALLEYLHHRGFPAPEIVRTRDSVPFLNWDNTVYELYEYIPGDICDSSKVSHIKAAARTLGQYHTLVNGFKHPLFQAQTCYSPTILKHILERLKRTLDKEPDELQLRIWERLQSHCQDLLVQIDQLVTFPHLVIHGDYWDENIIIQGNEVVGVVDYDHAHRCARIQEITEALIYFAREQPGHYQHIVYPGALDLQTTHLFLAAYGEINILTDEEIQALPYLIRTIWLCASLKPPLKPRLRLEKDQDALLELLDLADWAQNYTQDIIHIGFDVYNKKSKISLVDKHHKI
ncbi:MAG: hypothetical protein E4H27_06680 [Anaerolineales bacterium]|nr:MAG: hypothetical protein E4H27_06680 [Anaerolineales bacterium]